MENTNQTQVKVPRRVLGSLLASVSAGVVPRAGAPYIAIGRSDEIAALLSDLEQIDGGGGSMRFLIGRYGSGKSFLIQLTLRPPPRRLPHCSDLGNAGGIGSRL